MHLNFEATKILFSLFRTPHFLCIFDVPNLRDKDIKKLYKILIWTVLIAIITIWTGYITLRSYKVQTIIVNKVLKSLSERTGSAISVGEVRVSLFNELTLNDVYVADERQDTLLYLRQLQAGIDSMNLNKRQLFFDKLELDYGLIQVRKDSSRRFNFQYILDSLANSDTTDHSWMVNVNRVVFRDGGVRYRDELKEKTPGKFNPGDLWFGDVNFDMEFNSLSKDSLGVTLLQLAFQDHCGLKVDSLGGRFYQDSTRMSLEELRMQTPFSHFYIPEVSLEGRQTDFDQFFEKIRIKTQVENVQVGFYDLAYFIPTLRPTKDVLEVKGNFEGPLANFKGKDVQISFGNRSYFSGGFQVTGLPNLESTFLHAHIDRLQSNVADINVFMEEYVGHPLPLSKNFVRLGNFFYSGYVTGFVNNLVTYGTFNTDLGVFSTDMSMATSPQGDFSYSGQLRTENFNLGTFLESQNIGSVTMNMSGKGGQKEGKPFESELEGRISKIALRGYTYNNILLSGEVKDKMFDGSVLLNDPFVKLSFTGHVDFTEDLPEFDFLTEVYAAQPYHLNLTDRYPEGALSFKLSTNFKGNDIDNINGEIRLFDCLIKNKGQEVEVGEFLLKAISLGEKNRITLHSDYLSGQIEGKYQFKDLSHSFMDILHGYVPAVAELLDPKHKSSGRNVFSFNFQVSPTENLARVLEVPYGLVESGYLKGHFDDLLNDFRLEGRFPGLRIGGNKLQGLSFLMDTQSRGVKFVTRLGRLEMGSRTLFENLTLNTNAIADSMHVGLSWGNAEEVTFSGSVHSNVFFSLEGEKGPLVTHLDIAPSQVIVKDSVWKIAPSSVDIRQRAVDFDRFRISSNQQFLAADGVLSDNPLDSMELSTGLLDLKYLTELLRLKGLKLEGLVSGNTVVKNVFGNPVLKGDVVIDELMVNEQRMGRFQLSSRWDATTKQVKMDATTTKGRILPLKLKGFYSPVKDSLELKVQLRKFHVEFLRPYLDKAVQNIRGMASGTMYVKGGFKSPFLEGRLFIQKGGLDVDYLQTSYFFTDSVRFTKNDILFDKLKIYDEKGNLALFSGNINHSFFSNMVYNLSLVTDRIQALNTTPRDNDLFYGAVFVSGRLLVTGAGRDVTLNVGVRTEGGTQFFIPLTSSEVAGEDDFIRFVTKGEVPKEKKVEPSVPGGFEMILEVEATPVAEVQLIFDSTIGDLIKGAGNGNLKMVYNKQGAFEMFGDMTIERGEYLFTLQNIINKKFDVRQGGMISWNGDPYDARLNLMGVYKLRAPLYDLIPLEDKEELKRRIPIEVQMKLSDQLMRPAIRFDIDLPNTNEETKSMMNSYINSDEEMNRQVFSLLVLNRFYTPDHLKEKENASSRTTDQAAMVTTTELLSNQLSNWLSQISNEVDIGVNYRPGDEITSNEVEVALSTQILDDRVSINGNFGYREGTENYNNFIGDFDVQVKLNNKGNLLLKAYTHTNDYLYNETSPTTQGLGFSYKQDFDNFDELLKKYWDKWWADRKKDEVEVEVHDEE